ncbi:hypothetical protein ACP70R_002386 [Stipagrostis hirtigluma subsp. patula]
MAAMAGRLSQKFLASFWASASVTRSAPGGGIGTRSNLFHGAAVRPGTGSPNSGIQGYAARYFNTVSRSHADAKTSWPPSERPRPVSTSAA